MKLELKLADVSDAKEILDMQVKSFKEYLIKYQDIKTSPANEKIDKVISRIDESNSYMYFIIADGKKVGAIRIVNYNSDSYKKRISPVFILPEHRKHGYASQAIITAEKIHGSSGWQLDTILEETRVCKFYEKLGYTKTAIEEVINDKMTLVRYEK